jgi:integrase
MTFQELTDWYLGLETVKALSSFSTVEIYLKKFNSEFGNVMVNQIKPSDMENLQVKRRAEGKADATVDHEIRAAKGVINKAFNDDLVSGDTLRAFKKVKKLLRPNSNARDKVISSAQFKALMESEKLPLHTKGILTTGYWTGMRRGEILSLVWPKVDMKKSFIYLDAKDTKEEKEKAIPIGVELHRVLETIPRVLHDDHVFLYRGKPVRDIRAGIQEACKEAGIEYGRGSRDGFVFHDLRHTFITDMRKAGVERTVTMAITGHAIKDMNQRYDTVDEKDKLKAVAVLEVHRRKESASVDQNVDQART